MRKPKIVLVSCSVHRKGNSYLALKEAEKGVWKRGGRTIWVFLKDQFHSKQVKDIQQADGIVFGTPVYFGAWNAYAQELYELLKRTEIDLFRKVVGFVTVGAKRNGGQETTVTFASWDLMQLGACVVNDGFPVSQFGGTCVGGLSGDVENDKEGLEMSFNLGKRITETAMILLAGNLKEKVKTIDWPLKGNYTYCRGCAECPSPVAKDRDYKCRYYDDDLHKVHSKIMEADLIKPKKYDLRFHERTRYLRRDNYRLTYHTVLVKEPRWIPLFIKQNSILCTKKAKEYASLIKSGKKIIKLERQIYEPIGYQK